MDIVAANFLGAVLVGASLPWVVSFFVKALRLIEQLEGGGGECSES